ncbi:MAG: iron-responsive transcriptional regulator RirA, partial [Devosia nanyangense]|nr:iron-responsive transcriptional regulator RirA [Devosia nanyangense]
AEALQAFFNVLESYTIADLSDKKRNLRARLGIDLGEPLLAAH